MSSFLIFFSFSFHGCQEVIAPDADNGISQTAPSKKSKIELNDLKSIAKTLANSLEKETLFSVVEKDVSSSTKNEKIVDGLEFFTRSRNANSLKKTNASNVYEAIINNSNLKKTSKVEMEAFKNAIEKLDEGKVDIYFPVKDHYQKWLENKDALLIGFMDEENEFAPVTVYDLKGNSFKLSAKKVPDVPVLMVNACEHHGVHEVKAEQPLYQRVRLDEDDDGIGGGVSGTTKKDRTIFFEWLAFDDWTDYEPWGSGDPEFRIDFYITKSARASNRKFGDEYGYWKGYWYTLGTPVYHKYISDGGWNHKHLKLFTIHKDDIDKDAYRYAALHLLEEDGGGSVDVAIDVPLSDDGKTKATIKFTIGRFDDKVGVNSYIKLWGDPIYKNRAQQPSKGGMTDGIGDAYFSVWWE